MSYDGNRVSFGSGAATNLFAGDLNNASDIVVRDVAAGTTVLAAQTTAGVLANGTTERSAISADGRAVVFEAPAGTFNLVPGDVGTWGNDAIVRNLQTGTTTAASDPTRATGSGFPDISGDGRFVVFETGETYDAANDIAGNNVYRRDMTTAAGFTLVSARNGRRYGGGQRRDRPAISADGSRVSFTSPSTDLIVGDTNAVADVYTRDIGTKGHRGGRARRPPARAERHRLRAIGHRRRREPGDVRGPRRRGPHDTARPHRRQPPARHHREGARPHRHDGPPIQITSTTAAAGGFALVVTATDPSGVGSVTANGAALRPGAGATFSGTAPAAPDRTLRVDARDGSGNASTLVVVPTTGPGPPISHTPPKINQLRAKLVKGRIVVSLRLSTAARVKAQLLRSTVKVFKKAPKRRVVLLGVGRP